METILEEKDTIMVKCKCFLVSHLTNIQRMKESAKKKIEEDDKLARDIRASAMNGISQPGNTPKSQKDKAKRRRSFQVGPTVHPLEQHYASNFGDTSTTSRHS